MGEAADGDEAAGAIEALVPDVVFLDVKMPGRSGLEVLRDVPPERAPAVVMVTAFDEYAVEAFDIAAVDYLLKPFDDERFQRAFERARNRIRADEVRDAHDRLLSTLSRVVGAGEVEGDGVRDGVGGVPGSAEPGAEAEGAGVPDRPGHLERIGIESRGRIHVVAVEEIDYVTANGNYVDLHVGERTHLVRESLKELARRLPPDRFCRIHRSTIVNLERVGSIRRKSYGDCAVELTTGDTLKGSRTYRDELAERLGIEI